MNRPNTTQRSWDNYEGDNPIKRWVGRSPIGESRFYSDSSKYGPGSTWAKPKKEEEIPDGLSDWERLQRDTALKRGLDEFKKGKRVDGGDIYTV